MKNPDRCISCDRTVEWKATQHGGGWPNDAVLCTSYGNYGSTTFDSFHGEQLLFLLCDECVRTKGGSIRVRQSKRVPKEYEDLGTYPEWEEEITSRMRKASEMMAGDIEN